MNYLGHYAYNHVYGGLDARPYFVLGVALPDLWMRFSRSRRLRWKAIRAARPADPRVADLRAGLLNHVEADRRFHVLPVFERWRADLKNRLASQSLHAATVDFLSHLIPELVLDRLVCLRSPWLAEEFYRQLALCDYRFVEFEISSLADVNADGLAHEIDAFVRRRFLPRFAEPETLIEVVEFVLSLTNIPECPSRCMLADMILAACEIVDPELVWAQIQPPSFAIREFNESSLPRA